MEFDVQVDISDEEGHFHEASGALSYCFLRSRDFWPRSVAIAETGQVFFRTIIPVSKASQLTIYPDYDKVLVTKLFEREAPSLVVTYRDGTLTFTGRGGASLEARKLSRLPVWSHRISGRFSVQ